MKVYGNNVVLFERVVTNISYVIVDNIDSTQDVTFTWDGVPPGTTAVTLSYNDGTWHDFTSGFVSPRTITIPDGSHTYRLIFERPTSSVTITTFPGTYTDLLPYACARNCTITINTETIETSVSGSGLWATFLPTKNSFSISMDGVVSLNESDMLTLADLHAKQFAQTLLTLRYERTDEGGSVYANDCSGYITSASDTGNFDDMDTFSIEIQGTGAITQLTESDRVLEETGSYILEETGDFILTE